MQVSYYRYVMKIKPERSQFNLFKNRYEQEPLYNAINNGQFQRASIINFRSHPQ